MAHHIKDKNIFCENPMVLRTIFNSDTTGAVTDVAATVIHFLVSGQPRISIGCNTELNNPKHKEVLGKVKLDVIRLAEMFEWPLEDALPDYADSQTNTINGSLRMILTSDLNLQLIWWNANHQVVQGLKFSSLPMFRIAMNDIAAELRTLAKAIDRAIKE